MSPKNAAPSRRPNNTLPDLQQSIASPRSISVENAKEERETLQREMALQKQVETSLEALKEIEKVLFSNYDYLLDLRNLNPDFPVTYEREGVKVLKEMTLKGKDLERYYLTLRLRSLGKRNSLTSMFANRKEKLKAKDLSYNQQAVKGFLILKKMTENKDWHLDQKAEIRNVKFAQYLPAQPHQGAGNFRYFAVLEHNGQYHAGVSDDHNRDHLRFSDEAVQEIGEGNDVELKVYHLPKMWENDIELAVERFILREKLL